VGAFLIDEDDELHALADDGDTTIGPFGDLVFGDSEATITGRAGRWRLHGTRAVPYGTSLADGELRDGDLLRFPRQGSVHVVRFVVGDAARVLDEDRHVHAILDAMTGTFNRRFLRAQLARVRSGAILAIDIDRLKHICDRYGHHAGDEVIVRTAAVLRGHVRWPELVARYGGEEFAVVLPGSTIAQACERAEAMRRACEPPVTWEDETLTATISIGVAALTGDLDGLRHGDDRVVEAKVAGRNRVSS
jgi:diguanylate cyclase (GGDEF)-like protein